MITSRWKKCPRCGGRYGFETHGGASKGWTQEFFGPVTETCPMCGVTLATGKVSRISEMTGGTRAALFFMIALEGFSMLVWAASLSALVAFAVAYFAKSNRLGVGIGVTLFVLAAVRVAQVDKKNYDRLR